MHPRLVGWFARALLRLWLAVVVVPVFAPDAEAQTVTKAPAARGFSLMAPVTRLFDVNRVSCPVGAWGEICSAVTNATTIDGAAWPFGTTRHVFGSGLSVAALVGPDGGPWAGDTTGAMFYDPKGTTVHGDIVEPIHASYATGERHFGLPAAPADSADWPDAARVPSTGPAADLFAPMLRGRLAASDGDAWFASWDGNPQFAAGRPHPLGVLVETRLLGWRGPQWNNDIVYVAYTIHNVTARDPTAYASARPEIRDLLAEYGRRFQDLNEAEFGVSLPDGGYRLEQLHAGLFHDADITDAGNNRSSAAMPLATGFSWHAAFGVDFMAIDPAVHSPPFFAGAGFAGIAVLGGFDGSAALHYFSETVNSFSALRDPNDVEALFRYFSGQLGPEESSKCNQPEPDVNRICFLRPFAGNTRFMQSLTPVSLGPGQAVTTVVAYVFAAPVRVDGYVPGTDVAPGTPLRLTDPVLLAEGANLVDSIAGFRGFTDRNGDGVVDPGELDLVPGSFYGKVRLAQVVFANGFISPQAPEAPDFYLIPGDDRVTVVWRPSASELTGDPFFSLARDALLADGSPNPLYDPSYRQFDVEGYRIYRGRSSDPGDMELVAQFDYAGTSITDYAGQVNPDVRCAPELSVLEGCPVAFDPVRPGVARTTGVEYELRGHLPQVRLGERYRADGGLVFAVAMDSVRGAALEDAGVPFAWIDDQVRNNFRYHYAVTAFDVNSWQSGPASAESAMVPKSVIPRRPASNARSAAQPVMELLGGDGSVLDPGAAGWDIDPETGRFNGAPPPTNAFSALVEGFVAELAPATSLEVRLDSVVAYMWLEPQCGNGAVSNALGSCYVFYVTFDRDGEVTTAQVPTPWPVWSSFGSASISTEQLAVLPIAVDPEAGERYGIPAEGYRAASAGVGVTLSQYIDYSSMEGQGARRDRFGDGANISVGGSRWFEGTEETLADPTYGIRVGHIGAVDTIWAPIHHTDTLPGNGIAEIFAASNAMQCYTYGFGGLSRMADIRVIWGAGGTIASIRDVTHSLPMQFSPNAAASYGFVTDANDNGVLDWTDFDLIPNVAPMIEDLGFCNVQGVPVASLVDQPVFGPTSIQSVTDGFTATGAGFGILINGERFIFELPGGNPPAEGAVWTLRSYSGRVDAAIGMETTDPDGYRYRSPAAGRRSAAVAGLRIRFTIPRPEDIVEVTSNSLRQVHTVPDPFYLTSGFDAGTGERAVKFVNLPNRAILRIYSMSGVLVDIIEHNDASLGGTADWDLRNRDGTPIAPGVYFYHIESGSARAVGKFTVVPFEP